MVVVFTKEIQIYYLNFLSIYVWVKDFILLEDFLEFPQPCPPYWKIESTWMLGVTTYNKKCDKKQCYFYHL